MLKKNLCRVFSIHKFQFKHVEVGDLMCLALVMGCHSHRFNAGESSSWFTMLQSIEMNDHGWFSPIDLPDTVVFLTNLFCNAKWFGPWVTELL